METEKDFDQWNTNKKQIDTHEAIIDIHEREVWWCAIGVNVGSEQYSSSEDFSRPVLVVRRFSPTIFWGIPFTTKINVKVPFRVLVKIENIRNDVLIQQMRAFDTRRLYRKLTVMSEEDFMRVAQAIVDVVIKTNPAFAGFSEAEATVNSIISESKHKSNQSVNKEK